MFAHLLERTIQKRPQQDSRATVGILSGCVGFLLNLFLVLIKLFAGFQAGSVSIIADAVNNLADSATSIVTLVGFSIASKPPDQDHPYGHERFEYISGFVISMVLVLIGFQFLRSSMERFLNPTTVTLTPLLIALLLLSIFVKMGLARFYHVAADRIDSSTLQGASMDSRNDVIITSLVLVGGVIEKTTDFDVDGIVGIVLALFIIWNGLQLVRQAINELLGSRPSALQLLRMKQRLDERTDIVGYHDLLVHQYGPGKTFATIHIELDDRHSLIEAHQLLDRIEKDFQEHLDVSLVCHVDPIAIHNEAHTNLYRLVKQQLQSYHLNLKFHDFQVTDREPQGIISFDVVVPEETKLSNTTLQEQIERDLHDQIGPYSLHITLDRLDLLKGISTK